MATVLQPPFYVPRAPDQAFWAGRSQGLPPALLSSLLQLYFASPQWQPVGDQTTAYWSPRFQRNVALLTATPATQPKQPQRHFDYQIDGPIWVGQPNDSAIIQLLTAVKFFGKGGQAPAKQWRYDYQIDAPLWLGTPQRAATIRLLTAVKFFGAGGQSPTKRWRYDYQIDAPIWVGHPLAAYLANTPGPPVPPVSNATDYILRARRRSRR